MRTSLTTVFSAVLMCLPSISAAKPIDPQLSKLIREIDHTRSEYKVPAVGFTLVSADDIVWSGAWGLADLDTGEQVNSDTMFRIGSITKSFTSLAILILAEQSKLRLDQKVHSLVHDAPITNRWEDTHPIRIAHLLEHTAGFLDITKAEFDHSDPKPLPLEQGLMFNLKGHTAKWPPGMHSSYSNAGAGFAAYVLEKITGQRYEDFVEEQLFLPLGMTSASFFRDEETRSRLATGYDTDGRTVIPYWHMIYRPFGAINATPKDMAPFLQLLINKGSYRGKRLLKAASVERMEIPKTTLAARSGLAFGYGLGNYQYLRDGILFHGHGGDGDGYLAHYAYNRDTGLGYFVVINAFMHEALRAIRGTIENYIIHGTDRLEPPSIIVSQKALKRLVGRYQPLTWRFPWQDFNELKHQVLEVSFKNGSLFIQHLSGEEYLLIPVNERHFRYRNETMATMAFIEGPVGELYLQNEEGNFKRVSSGDN